MVENYETPQVTTDIFNYDFEKMIKEKKIKKEYRNAAAIVGIPYLLCFLISYFWARFYLITATYMGADLNDAIDFANMSGVDECIQIFLSVFLFVLPFSLALVFSRRTVSKTVSFSAPEKKTALPYYLFGLAFCLFSNVAVSYAGGIFEKFGLHYDVDFGENPTGFFGIMLAVISICIIPALVEEFAFRGVVMGITLPFSESFAVFSSALLFGIMHGNFEQMPFAFLVGLVLGLIRVKTGTLWVCIALHFTNNLISLSIDYISRYVSAEQLNICYALFISLALILVVPAMFLAEKRFKAKAFSLETNSKDLPEKEKYRQFFSSPFIIIPVCLYFYSAFKFFI
ncbi:MAG: CPBP family intramembrane metalloprotease [Clostridia bacterium]|nr:CPBP family intramembrane metalloprotease [Clostridia bacterium]